MHKALAILLLLSAGPRLLSQQSVDPLWAQAQGHVLATKHLVARAVATHTEVYDGQGRSLDVVDQGTAFTAWKDGEPVRAVVSLRETQKSGLGELRMELGIADHPEKGLPLAATLQRREELVLEGRPTVLFHLAGMKGKASFTAKVHVDKGTGRPLRAEYVVDPSTIPMTRQLGYAVTWGLTPGGQWMPRQVTFDTLLSVLFKKVRLSVRQDLDGWFARP